MKRTETVSGRFGIDSPYNPNRFNGLAATIAYIVAVAAFAVMPYVVSEFFYDEFLLLYEYDIYAYSCVNILLSQAVIFLVAAILSIACKSNPFSGGGYAFKFDGIQTLMGAIAIVGITCVFYSLHTQFSDDANFVFGFISSDVEEHYSNLTVLYALIYLMLSSMLPAIIEEMLFRGVIMRGLEQFGGVFCVIASSAAFSLMHGNFSQIILQFVGGLAIGTVVYLTKNWFLGSFMHFFNNAFAVAYVMITVSLTENAVELKFTAAARAATTLIGLAMIIIAFLYFAGFYVENVKRECTHARKNDRYEKKRYYAVKSCYGDESVVDSSVIAPLRIKGGVDESRYLIYGKYRKINARSNSIATLVLYGVGIVSAVVSLFL